MAKQENGVWEKTLSAPPERHETLRQRHAERIDPNVAFASLDIINVVPMKISARCRFFLRRLSFLSRFH